MGEWYLGDEKPGLARAFEVCVCVCVYIYVYIYIHTHIHIYIFLRSPEYRTQALV